MAAVGTLECRKNFLGIIVMSCHPIWPRFKQIGVDAIDRISQSLVPEAFDDEELLNEVH